MDAVVATTTALLISVKPVDGHDEHAVAPADEYSPKSHNVAAVVVGHSDPAGHVIHEL